MSQSGSDFFSGATTTSSGGSELSRGTTTSSGASKRPDLSQYSVSSDVDIYAAQQARMRAAMISREADEATGKIPARMQPTVIISVAASLLQRGETQVLWLDEARLSASRANIPKHIRKYLSITASKLAVRELIYAPANRDQPELYVETVTNELLALRTGSTEYTCFADRHYFENVALFTSSAVAISILKSVIIPQHIRKQLHIVVMDPNDDLVAANNELPTPVKLYSTGKKMGYTQLATLDEIEQSKPILAIWDEVNWGQYRPSAFNVERVWKKAFDDYSSSAPTQQATGRKTP